MAKAVVGQCKCAHAAQDKLHGKGNRVMNLANGKKAQDGHGIFRCTVCGGEHHLVK